MILPDNVPPIIEIFAKKKKKLDTFGVFSQKFWKMLEITRYDFQRRRQIMTLKYIAETYAK